MDCDGTDCSGCAVCEEYDMGGDEPWEPAWLAPGTLTARCVFCHTVGDIAYYTRLGAAVGRCCARERG